MISDPSRRTFIASAASIAATLHASEPLGAEPTTATVSGPPVSGAVPFRFDRDAFAAVLNRPYPHRQLCAPQSYSDATVAMSHFKNSLAAYADPAGFAAGPNSLHCIAVLYAGASSTLVLDDAMYAKYHIGSLSDEEMRPNDTTHRAYWTALKHNPMADFTRPLVDAGVSFFVCNNALSSLAVQLAKRSAPSGVAVARRDVVAIHDELAEHFLPGTMLVPAGVAAVNAAQEAKFTFLP